VPDVRWIKETLAMFNLPWVMNRPSPPPDSFVHTPVLGLPPADVAAALALLDTLDPAIDRRVLTLHVLPNGNLRITTGHVTSPLHAHTHHLLLRRTPTGWQVLHHGDLVS
jgi:hypothetical protein